MPARNSQKEYLENSYYHIYNRGVEKRIIFQDEQDYSVFLSYLKTYLSPKDEKIILIDLASPVTNSKEKDRLLRLLHLNNFNEKIILLAYCLMPNHFHLLVKQKPFDGIDKFMNSLATRYTQYFNKKYKRVGSLYQAVYKAVLVNSEEQLLSLTSYIHRNPISEKPYAKNKQKNLFLQPSSLPEYLGKRQTPWIHPEDILSFFSKTNPKLSYQSLVEDGLDLSIIDKVLIEI